MKTCGNCKHRNTEEVASKTWAPCDCPVPPWAYSEEYPQNRWVRADTGYAERCPCWEEKDNA